MSTYRELSIQDGGATIHDRDGNVLYDPLYDIDEESLSKTDRLGVAYCRLNSWNWDEYICQKPDGFDTLPKFDRYSLERINHPVIMRFLSWILPEKFAKKKTKDDYIRRAMKAIEMEIGAANASRCHWVYGMKRTEEEWRAWWCTEHIPIKGLDC